MGVCHSSVAAAHPRPNIAGIGEDPSAMPHFAQARIMPLERPAVVAVPMTPTAPNQKESSQLDIGRMFGV